MPTFKERGSVEPTIKILKTLQPRIGITSDALAKMSQYVDQCKDEIGWLGTAYKLNTNTYYIKDTYLLEQEVHGTTTEITPEGLEAFATKLLEQGEAGNEIWNNMKMWGHSHVNMEVFASGQDDKQMETFAESGHDWFIRLISNKKGEIKVDLYNYETGIIYNNTPWVEMLNDDELTIQREIDALYAKLDTIAEEREAAYKVIIEAEIKEKVRPKYVVNRTTTQIGLVKHDEKKTTISTANGSQKKNTGTSTTKTYTVTDDETQYASVGQWWTDEKFNNDDEVRKEFTTKDLLQFAECKRLDELDDELFENGFYNYFHTNDLERILRVAYKVKAKLEGQVK